MSNSRGSGETGSGGGLNGGGEGDESVGFNWGPTVAQAVEPSRSTVAMAAAAVDSAVTAHLATTLQLGPPLRAHAAKRQGCLAARTVGGPACKVAWHDVALSKALMLVSLNDRLNDPHCQSAFFAAWSFGATSWVGEEESIGVAGSTNRSRRHTRYLQPVPASLAFTATTPPQCKQHPTPGPPKLTGCSVGRACLHLSCLMALSLR